MEKQYDIENLSRVWERVNSYSSYDNPIDVSITSSPADPNTQLKDFIDSEASDAEAYSELAARSSGSDTARIFTRIANDKRRHIKRLLTEHFILTGDVYSPNISLPEKDGIITSIRKMYVRETDGIEAYLNAAKSLNGNRLGTVYSELATNKRRHAAAMLALIERFMD